MKVARFVALAGVCAGIMAFTAGCPGQQTNVFRLWIINASNEYQVTSVEISSTEDSDTRELLGDDMIPTNQTGVFTAVAVEDFENETVEVTIRGVSNNAKGVFDVSTTVEIPDPVNGRLTVPIVVEGDTSATYDGTYYPLSENAKIQMMLAGAGR